MARSKWILHTQLVGKFYMEPEPEIFYIDDTLNVPTLKWSKCSRSIASSTLESPTSPVSASFPDLPIDETVATTPVNHPLNYLPQESFPEEKE